MYQKNFGGINILAEKNNLQCDFITFIFRKYILICQVNVKSELVFKMVAKGNKKKGKKLSKAEKEKLKKEEAERKAQEEEEARIKAEEEDRKREERERQEREERRLLEEQERVRHQAEIDELNTQLKENKQYLVNLRKTIEERNKWNRYLLCNGRPDPTDKKDINTFISLWRENNEDLELNRVLKKSELVLELLKELKNNIENLSVPTEYTDDGEKDHEQRPGHTSLESYKESTANLQSLMREKIDAATLTVLISPHGKIDVDTLNIFDDAKSAHIKLCLWGNAAKNPRIKQVEFKDRPFTMELPKQIALADIAVRVLYINFDFLSPRCSTYALKIKKSKKKEIGNIQIIENIDQATSVDKIDDGDGKEENQKTTSSLAPSTKNLLGVKESIRSESRTSISASTTSARRETDEPPVEDQDAIKCLKPTDSLDEEDYIEEDVIDLRSFSPIGSLIMIELIQLPPQAKEVNDWVIQKVHSKTLQRIPYGNNDQQNSSSSLHHSSVSAIPDKIDITPSIGYKLPIAISVRVDDNVVFHEPPQIARWDETSQHWRTSGITDFRYETDERMVFFRTAFFGSFALMQDIYLNMPFQSWQLRPTSLNECVLNIIGGETEVDIVIKEGLCCVTFPTEMQQLKYLTKKWMAPKELLKMLRSSGVNLFPYEDGEKYVSVCKKVEGLVGPLHEQMALSASAFSYAWSKWNSDIGEEKVVVQATEWVQTSPPDEDSYHLYMASTRICCKLKTVEFCEDFSTDVYPESQMHPDLYHMLRDGASDKAKERLRDTSVVFIDCVHQLLDATKLFVYS
ncbi:dynein axonemal intermediate chain 7-like isoform X2 [Hydractinia symbiolongicarpus]|uniref:dynein axonemal intermediate chain 7-like isoform X2 n=1 Tax=Hydractinia symbiolongicarpus TaxID=13093 RepID=UPI00254D33E4|nr:dynein axonemal intermediate chain 7-like isoform X2 [Hydractinia symbiolongicarpus]